MRPFLTKAAAILLTLCLMRPQGFLFAAAPADGQGELDALLGSPKSKVVVFDGIEVTEDRVTMKLSGKAKHQTQLLADPPRILVDLFGTDYQVGVKTVPGKGPRIKGVRGNQYKGAPDMVSRIVVDLSGAVPYSVGHEGNNLVVSLSTDGEVPAEEAQAEAQPEPVKPAAAKTETAKPAAAKTETAKPVAAQPAKKEEPAVSAAVPAEKKADAAKGAVVAAKPVEASAEVKDAPAAPVRPTVAVPRAQPKTAVVVAQMPAVAALAGKASAAVEREAAPAVGGKCKTQPGGDIMSRLPCDPVDLDFDNTPIKDILALLSAKTKVNIISGPEVAGNLTLHLKGVPFDEAFRTILTMTSLTTMQAGENILRVLPPSALTAVQAAASNTTKIITVRYGKASDILATITSVRNAEGRSPRGAAIVDDKTNSIILTDNTEGLASMERLIARLDEVPKQVLIEAKIVEVNLDNTLDFGIRWDIYKTQTGEFLGQQGLTTIGSRLKQTTDLTSQNIVHDNKDAGGSATGWLRHNAEPSSQPESPATGVNFLPANPLGLLTIGRVTNNYFLNMQLGAAATQNRLKVLSDPKVATLNNKEANIEVTDSVPYDTSNVSANGTISRSVTYKDVGIKLKVTPIISADESRVTLDIKPEVSKLGSQTASVAGSAPPVSQSKVSTLVIVKDGETVVIGGLITDRKDQGISKVPLLGDIPLLGWFFKRKVESRRRVELLIFVTPRIIKEP